MTTQVPLVLATCPSGKQRLANKSIILPLCPPRQIVYMQLTSIHLESTVMLLGDKPKRRDRWERWPCNGKRWSRVKQTTKRLAASLSEISIAHANNHWRTKAAPRLKVWHLYPGIWITLSLPTLIICPCCWLTTMWLTADVWPFMIAVALVVTYGFHIRTERSIPPVTEDKMNDNDS